MFTASDATVHVRQITEQCSRYFQIAFAACWKCQNECIGSIVKIQTVFDHVDLKIIWMFRGVQHRERPYGIIDHKSPVPTLSCFSDFISIPSEEFGDATGIGWGKS